MATVFNNPQDVQRAISILEWTRQYMEMNEAHISKLGHVRASLVLLRQAAGTNPDWPEDRAQLVATTLANCIKFYNLNSAEPVDKAWTAGLPALSSVSEKWF